MITIRILFLPLFIYAGIVSGYSLAAVDSLNPAVVCGSLSSDCSRIAVDIFKIRLASIDMLSTAVWHIRIADVLVLFAVIGLVASGASTIKHAVLQPLSVSVMVAAVWLFVAHPLYTNSLFFILIFIAAMGLVHDAMKKPQERAEQATAPSE